MFRRVHCQQRSKQRAANLMYEFEANADAHLLDLNKEGMKMKQKQQVGLRPMICYEQGVHSMKHSQEFNKRVSKSEPKVETTVKHVKTDSMDIEITSGKDNEDRETPRQDTFDIDVPETKSILVGSNISSNTSLEKKSSPVSNLGAVDYHICDAMNPCDPCHAIISPNNSFEQISQTHHPYHHPNSSLISVEQMSSSHNTNSANLPSNSYDPMQNQICHANNSILPPNSFHQMIPNPQTNNSIYSSKSFDQMSQKYQNHISHVDFLANPFDQFHQTSISSGNAYRAVVPCSNKTQNIISPTSSFDQTGKPSQNSCNQNIAFRANPFDQSNHNLLSFDYDSSHSSAQNLNRDVDTFSSVLDTSNKDCKNSQPRYPLYIWD